MEYGTYIVALAIVTGVSQDQIMIKPLWEGEAPISIEDEGISKSTVSEKVYPGDFVLVKIKVYEPRIPRRPEDLEPPLTRSGENVMEIVSIRRLSPEEVLSELIKISSFIRSTHYSIYTNSGRVEVEDDESSDDWSWVRGTDDN